MFWKFGYHNPSAIGSLLEKGDEGFTLEELFDQVDFIQECKNKNDKLIA